MCWTSSPEVVGLVESSLLDMLAFVLPFACLSFAISYGLDFLDE